MRREIFRSLAFELWCWRRLLRVPWTTRRSNQSILKEIPIQGHTEKKKPHESEGRDQSVQHQGVCGILGTTRNWKRQEGFSPREFRGNEVLETHWFQTFGLPNYENINLFCLGYISPRKATQSGTKFNISCLETCLGFGFHGCIRTFYFLDK